MEKTMKAKWIKALRSGRYKQGQFALQKASGKSCCIGVLCRINRIKPSGTNGDGEKEFDGNNAFLTKELRKKFGITDRQQKRLAHLNDHDELGFEDIAKYIQRYI